MGPIKCEIQLEKPSKIFFPGESIKGSVVINLKTASKISVMNLHLVGEAKFGNDKLETYRETKSVEMNKILPSGTDKFPITWSLPFEIPSSFNWKSGSLNYYFISEINNRKNKSGSSNSPPKDVIQAVAVSQIEIHNAIDLNLLSKDFQIPKSYNESYSRNHERDCSSTVVVDFMLNRRCFVPGEVLKFDCCVTYDSSSHRRLRAFQGLRVCLEQEDSYFKDGYIHKLKTNIWEKIGPAIKPNDTTIWENSIKIPNNCMSTPPGNTGLVCVQYFLVVTSSLWLREEESQFRIPIVIGMIPLEEQSQLTETALNHEDFDAEIIGNTSADDAVNDFDLENYIREAEEQMQLQDSQLPDYSNYHLIGIALNNGNGSSKGSKTPPPTYDEAVFLTDKMDDKPPNYVL